MEQYFNPNATRYPTRHDVVKTVETWASSVMPDYSLASIDEIQVTGFAATFVNPVTKEAVYLHLQLYPNQHKAYPGWHVRNPELWRIGVIPVNGHVKVYDQDLETLMMRFPSDRIVFIDNEDDQWPIFGYAVIGEDGFKGFIQHKPEHDEEDFTFNGDLRYDTVVTNDHTLARITDDMWGYVQKNLKQGLLGKY